MKKYILIGLMMLSISIFLITSELKTATFTPQNTAAADGDKDKGDGSPCG